MCSDQDRRGCAAARRLHAGQGPKEEVGLPVALHTHDTSRPIAAPQSNGGQRRGRDAVDGRFDAMSGLDTSQPKRG